MHPDVELMVSIQGVDLRAIALHREIARLPKEVAALEKVLETHLRKLEADQALLDANAGERKKVDAEIDVQRQKISKLKDQMMSAKTNEQLHAFQHEISFCESAIARHEEQLMVLAEQNETLDRNVRGAEADLEAEKETVAAKRAAAETRTAEDQSKLKLVLAERKELIVKLSSTAKSIYDKLTKKSPGQVISDASRGRCGACNLDLRPQLFQDLRKADRLMLCEHCGRLLHYNPALVFDNAAPGPAPAAAPAKRESKRTAARNSEPPASGRRVDMT